MRPCPYVGCRYNAHLDVERGRITRQVGQVPDPDGPSNCVLDAEFSGGMEEAEIARAMGLREQEVSDILESAVRKLRHYSHAKKLLEVQRDFQEIK